MNKLLICFLILITQAGLAQTITVKGNVKDAVKGKRLKSKITYHSYPTGGISGSFNDSTYSFDIFGSAKYQVTADADGYIPSTIIVDPREAVNNVISRDINLTSKGETIVLDHLIFEQGKAVINPKSFQQLDELVAMMKDSPKVEIQLEGHTDNIGNPEANLKLSLQRVDAVKKYITTRGVNKNRVKTKAFGGSQPVAKENTEAARAKNRRVEMRVLKD
jgi:outer membrane protein OmpA-like peptidoglycan-associated protein